MKISPGARRIALALLAAFAVPPLSAARAVGPASESRLPPTLRFPLAEVGSVPLTGRVLTPPSLFQGLVVTADDRGVVTAFVPDGPRTAWTYTAASALETAPVAGADNLYLLLAGNRLVALDPGGRPRWTRDLGADKVSGVVESEGLLLTATATARLDAFDPATGEPRWSFAAKGPLREAPTAGRGYFVFVAGDLHLQAVNVRGREQYARAFGAAVARRPLIASGRLFFGTTGREIVRFHPLMARVEWRRRLGGVVAGDMILAGHTLVVPCSDSVIYGLDEANGTILWWRAAPSRVLYPILALDGTILVTGQAPALSAFDAASGRSDGRFEASGNFLAAPLVTGKRLAAVLKPVDGPNRLALLSREVALTLKATPESPRRPGVDVTFTAAAVGFTAPQFEFVLGQEGWREVRQPASPKATWTWFPDKPGEFTVVVTARDAESTRTASLTYTIALPSAAPAPDKKKSAADAPAPVPKKNATKKNGTKGRIP